MVTLQDGKVMVQLVEDVKGATVVYYFKNERKLQNRLRRMKRWVL